MAGWIRRSFTSAGLTQIPPGPHIGALQGRYGGGVVMLCIDVSGSMDGKPIHEAVRGAKTFVTEAVEARYKVGVMLWNTGVTSLAEPTSDGKGAIKLLGRTNSTAGGNNLIGPLNHCHKILDRFKDEIRLDALLVYSTDWVTLIPLSRGADAARAGSGTRQGRR